MNVRSIRARSRAITYISARWLLASIHGTLNFACRAARDVSFTTPAVLLFSLASAHDGYLFPCRPRQPSPRSSCLLYTISLPSLATPNVAGLWHFTRRTAAPSNGRRDVRRLVPRDPQGLPHFPNDPCAFSVVYPSIRLKMVSPMRARGEHAAIVISVMNNNVKDIRLFFSHVLFLRIKCTN